ncbi:MAG: family 16 glycoside hydrolase [Bacteroidota bacterium]
MKQLILFFFLLTIGSTVLFSQTKKIAFTKDKWTVPKSANHTYEKIDGQQALRINGSAYVKEVEFVNGTLEVDIKANSNRSFAGILFRKQDNSMEEIYIRMHKSNQVSAIQYTPIFNKESNWQLYPQHQAKAPIKDNGWNHLKLEIMGSTAEVYLNDQLYMTVENLRTGFDKGQIGVKSLFDNHFANFRYTPKFYKPSTKKVSTKTVPANVINKWELSVAKRFDEELFASNNIPLDVPYKSYPTEGNGLLPISKHVAKPSGNNFERNSEDYVVVRLNITSEIEQNKFFSFDFSDKIILYLNGQELFRGNNAFRSKDVQYLGYLNIDSNTINLPLRKGNNELHCVIIEKANGWGLMGRFKDMKNISL